MSKGNGSGNEMQVWASVASGIVIGFVVGGALALLLAPKSGAQLRGDISEALDDLKDKAEQMVDELQVSAADVIDKSRSVLDETKENLLRSVEAGKEAYVQKKEELTAKLES
jgi:gas vesicle protein